MSDVEQKNRKIIDMQSQSNYTFSRINNSMKRIEKQGRITEYAVIGFGLGPVGIATAALAYILASR